MLNTIWAAMILLGISYGALTGNLPDITNAALSSAKEAISLSLTILGVLGFWSGIMKIATSSNLLLHLAKKMHPLLRFLFPDIPEHHPSLRHISTNIIANIFGLGWAATPAGLKAMESLSHLEKERHHDEHLASNEMCTFLVINISSLQLIPVNIIAYRSQYGSPDPTAIVGPSIAATLFSTLIAIIFCKFMTRKRV